MAEDPKEPHLGVAKLLEEAAERRRIIDAIDADSFAADGAARKGKAKANPKAAPLQKTAPRA
jgi:hypothetical protein